MIFVNMVLWLIIIPYILGKFLESKNENTILFSWSLGYVFEMGICLLLAIPMIINRVKFDVLLKCYNIVICIFTIISIFIYRKKIIPNLKINKKFSFFKILAILIVVTLMFVKFWFANVNNDDVSFVVLAVKMIDNGNMYCNGPEDSLEVRRALAPISSFLAIISKNIGIHVTIVMHTIEPIVFIAIGGILCYYFGKVIFKDKNDDTSYLFVFLMMLLYMYIFTTKGTGGYYLKYTWFGRSLIGAVFFPLLWKTMLEIFTNNDTVRNWITIFFVVSASCLCSEMAIALMSISIGVMTLIFCILNKKILYIFKSLICIIPCIILAILYLTIS